MDMTIKLKQCCVARIRDFSGPNQAESDCCDASYIGIGILHGPPSQRVCCLATHSNAQAALRCLIRTRILKISKAEYDT